MPKIRLTPSRYSTNLYDTVLVEPGQKHLLFGAKRIGTRQCNLKIPNQFPEEQSFVLLAFGTRVIDHDEERAMQVLDHLHMEFRTGTNTVEVEFYGPMTLMSRQEQVGFRLPRPIVVPERQEYSVVIRADSELDHSVAVRVHLMGLLRRERTRFLGEPE